jgi:hypothetical protein
MREYHVQYSLCVWRISVFHNELQSVNIQLCIMCEWCVNCDALSLTHSSSCMSWTSLCRISSSTLNIDPWGERQFRIHSAGAPALVISCCYRNHPSLPEENQALMQTDAHTHTQSASVVLHLLLMLKFLPRYRCFREVCLERAGRTERRSASSPVNTTTSSTHHPLIQNKLKQTTPSHKTSLSGAGCHSGAEYHTVP